MVYLPASAPVRAVTLVPATLLIVPANVSPVSLDPAVTVKVMVSPTFFVPEDGDMDVMEPVGVETSLVAVGVAVAVLTLPNASVAVTDGVITPSFKAVPSMLIE